MDTENKKDTAPEAEAKETESKEAEAAAAEENTAGAEEASEEEAGEKKALDEISETEEKLRHQVADLNDRYMRLYAEYDNYRKRTADAYSDLFPILDNFERAFENEDTTPEDFRKGVEMIYKQVQDIFDKAGLETFGEPGETFDPNIHNAVMHIDDPEKGENEIVNVFQKGYKLGDRVIRHAMVQVAN